MAERFELQNERKLGEGEEKVNRNAHGSGPASAVYSLGFVGAAVYFISQATSFWPGVLGLLKAIVWPAFLVYGLLKYLAL